MKPHDPQIKPERPWYKQLWFLALINGIGAINGVYGYFFTVAYVGEATAFFATTLIGFINACILVHTLWHDDDEMPRELSYYLVGIWTIALALLGLVNETGFIIGFCFLPIALIMTLAIVSMGGWRRLTGFISGAIGAVVTMIAVEFVANALGLFMGSIVLDILIVMLGGSVYGLIFADTIHRENRRRRRINAENEQQEKIDLLVAQGYTRKFNQNLVVGDDGELVEASDEDQHVSRGNS